MKERNFRSGGSSAAVKSGNDGVAVVANPLSAEPPTRREFEMQQQRIEEQQRCNEEQQRRIEEQQRQIDNLMKMVTAFKGGSPAIGTDALLESTESADHDLLWRVERRIVRSVMLGRAQHAHRYILHVVHSARVPRRQRQLGQPAFFC